MQTWQWHPNQVHTGGQQRRGDRTPSPRDRLRLAGGLRNKALTVSRSLSVVKPGFDPGDRWPIVSLERGLFDLALVSLLAALSQSSRRSFPASEYLRW